MIRTGSSRRTLTVVIVLCLLVFALAAYQSFTLLAQARRARLVAAERAIAESTVPLIRQERVSPALVRAAGEVLANERLSLNYLTLRNAAGETLVSQGRLENGWLAAAGRWRGLLYRTLSAENRRALTRDGQRIGTARYGVGWVGVVLAAGVTAWAWLALMLIAAVAACAYALRLKRAPAQPAELRQAPATAPPDTEPLVPPRRAPKKSFSPFGLRRSRTGDDGYAPIEPAAPAAVATPPRDASAQPAPAPPPAEAPRPPLQSEPQFDPQEPPAAQPVAPEAPSETEPSPAAPQPVAPQPAATAPEPAPQAGSEFHAPQLDAEPTLGDDTLDLCFYPIWRGADRRALAGASAVLAWRSGEGELADPASLTHLAERDGALRAFTHWIARRFSVLHSNWRNLELDTVPIVLPVPTAMLAFADAETVWQDAIVRTDRDPDDLILKLTRESAARNPSRLPMRRALAADETDGARAGGDVLCIKPADVADAPELWNASLDEPGPPILFGPVDEPEQWREALDHERVTWFSEERSGLCSMREFARLLARRECRAL